MHPDNTLYCTLLLGHVKGISKEPHPCLFDPEMDPQGIGYHIIQSKIAIGSGGLFGKRAASGDAE